MLAPPSATRRSRDRAKTARPSRECSDLFDRLSWTFFHNIVRLEEHLCRSVVFRLVLDQFLQSLHDFRIDLRPIRTRPPELALHTGPRVEDVDRVATRRRIPEQPRDFLQHREGKLQPADLPR